MIDPPANSRGEIEAVLEILARTYPQARCALHFRTPYQLLVATILSAQCTDERVNRVTPEFFRKYPDPYTLVRADPADVEGVIRSTGFFRNKARSLIGAAAVLVQKYDGRVPSSMEELVALPGVGRKTANVLLGNVFGTPGMVVDTHVKRVAFRLGWTRRTDPVGIESDLAGRIRREQWTLASHLLIFHGRAICKAPIPLCSTCPVFDLCPRAGVKKSR